MQTLLSGCLPDSTHQSTLSNNPLTVESGTNSTSAKRQFITSFTSVNITPYTCKLSCGDLIFCLSLWTNLFLPHGLKGCILVLLLSIVYSSQTCCGNQETCLCSHMLCFPPPVSNSASSVWSCMTKEVKNVWRLQSKPEIKLCCIMTAAKQIPAKKINK